MIYSKSKGKYFMGRRRQPGRLEEFPTVVGLEVSVKNYSHSPFSSKPSKHICPGQKKGGKNNNVNLYFI